MSKIKVYILSSESSSVDLFVEARKILEAEGFEVYSSYACINVQGEELITKCDVVLVLERSSLVSELLNEIGIVPVETLHASVLSRKSRLDKSDVKVVCDTLISFKRDRLLWCQGFPGSPKRYRDAHPEKFKDDYKSEEDSHEEMQAEKSFNMSVEDLENFHSDMCCNARDLMRAKSQDYNDPDASGDVFTNFKSSGTFGVHPVIGILLRMQDKMKRVESFVNRGDLRLSESAHDSCIDLLNYSVAIAAIIKEGENS